MARPPNADPDATKARILEAAARLFAMHGLAGTGVRDIAAEAGLSQSLVNHYFGSKDRLYRAVLRDTIRVLSELAGALASELTRDGTAPREVIARATRLGFRFAREQRFPVLLLNRSILETGALDPEIRRKSVVPFLDRTTAVLSALTGREAATLRLPVQSAVFLVVRYALAATADLAAVVGLPARGADGDVLAAVEDHLVEATAALLPRIG